MSIRRDTSEPLWQFIIDAGKSGPVLGLRYPGAGRIRLPREVAVRSVDARDMTTVNGVLDEFARAWDFPDYFGHNKDAFDECMRDLDSQDGRAAYVTVVSHASALLREVPAERSWFAESMLFYRDHYRDIASPPASFAVVLICADDDADDLDRVWSAAGAPPARLPD